MNIKKQSIKYIVFLVVGIVLILVGTICQLNGFWTGLGSGFIAVSVVRLVQMQKYKTDPDYAKQINISNHDERQSFVSEKAMVLTLKMIIYILLTSGIILYIFDQGQYGQFCMYGICVIMAIYFISSYFVNRKY